MSIQRSGSNPEHMGTLVCADELERRRSGAQRTVAPVTLPPRQDETTVADLREQYIALVAAREHCPERLTPAGLAVFEAHEQVASEYMAADPEEIYCRTSSGYLMRQRLREILPDWFTAE